MQYYFCLYEIVKPFHLSNFGANTLPNHLFANLNCLKSVSVDSLLNSCASPNSRSNCQSCCACRSCWSRIHWTSFLTHSGKWEQFITNFNFSIYNNNCFGNNTTYEHCNKSFYIYIFCGFYLFGSNNNNLIKTKPWWLSGLLCQSITNQCSGLRVLIWAYPFWNLFFSNFQSGYTWTKIITLGFWLHC